MDFKSFLKRFRWGALFPAVIALVIGILLLAIPTRSARALGISVGVFLAVSGILSVIAFLLDNSGSPAGLLAGVVELAAAVWLFVSSETALAVLALALGIIVLFRAIAIVLGAFLAREKKGRFPIVSCVVAAVLAAFAIVVMVDPFNTARTLMIMTGVAFLLTGAVELCYLLVSGLYRKAPSEYVSGMRELKEETDAERVEKRELPPRDSKK